MTEPRTVKNEDQLIADALQEAALTGETYRLQVQRDIERERNRRLPWIGAALLVALLALAWAVRWQPVETHSAAGQASIYMINRWTGEVRYVQGYNRLDVEPLK